MIILEIVTGAVFYVFRSRVRHLNPTQTEKFQVKTRQKCCSCCCGADSYTDWSKSVGWENHNAVPDSCCVTKTEGCGQDKTNVHKKGCISAIKRFLVKNFLWVGAVCITLGVAEVNNWGLLFCCCYGLL
uniref:Uncharacterized protein n=1 Tax=Acanthochromis polyacanthus TaxID=80966 RepID=A0A3Q1FER5_9TELE